jgi:hypothetical protein
LSKAGVGDLAGLKDKDLAPAVLRDMLRYSSLNP